MRSSPYAGFFMTENFFADDNINEQYRRRRGGELYTIPGITEWVGRLQLAVDGNALEEGHNQHDERAPRHPASRLASQEKRVPKMGGPPFCLPLNDYL